MKKKNTHGGARPNSGPTPTPINVSRAITLRGQGVSYQEIGRRFGVSAAVVSGAIKRHRQAAADGDSPAEIPQPPR